MYGGAGQPFFAAEGVADLHEVVVDDDGEVVSGHPIRLEQDLVVDIGGVEAYFAADHVDKLDFLVRLQLDAYDIGGAGFEQGLGFGRIEL
jgi:hypothetical protein